MARKVFKVSEINCVEDLLKAFDLWTEIGAEGRKSALSKAGEEKYIIVKNPKSWVYFEAAGNVFVSTGKYHSIYLRSGFKPINKYTHKDGKVDKYELLTKRCLSYDSKWDSMENTALVSALLSCF